MDVKPLVTAPKGTVPTPKGTAQERLCVLLGGDPTALFMSLSDKEIEGLLRRFFPGSPPRTSSVQPGSSITLPSTRGLGTCACANGLSISYVGGWIHGTRVNLGDSTVVVLCEQGLCPTFIDCCGGLDDTSAAESVDLAMFVDDENLGCKGLTEENAANKLYDGNDVDM